MGPLADPFDLIKLREDIFAADLIIAAAGWLDLFTWLSRNPCDWRASVRGWAWPPTRRTSP